MDNSRTLPPQVRGKVTAILDFFIDEIVISKNVSFLTRNFDIITQVQWWGEVSPLSIRPKMLHLPKKLNINTFKPCIHSAQYEIKTTMDLFKSYLNACEVLELLVYETVDNYVIGSAFLKNLTYLLNKNNEIILLPIIDYLGEEIGQLKIHTYFFQYPKENKKNSEISNKLSIDVGAIGRNDTGFLKNDFMFPIEKTIFYDGYSRLTDFKIESDSEHPISDNKSNFTASNFRVDFNSPVINQPKETVVNLPKVCVTKDSSKVLNFDVGLKKKAKSEKINGSKLANKFSSDSIKCKSKAQTVTSNLSKSPVKLPQKITSTNHLSKPVKKTVNQDLIAVPVKLPNKNVKNSKSDSNLDTDSNKRVFDYLLGSSMSPENEEIALNDLKKMSPSHDIVSSINELCLTPGKTKICDNSEPNVQFDLTNPIERNYYEMFFVKNDTNDFEIAQLLNEPRNKSFDKYKSTNNDDCEIDNKLIDKIESKLYDNLLDKNKGDGLQNSCARCKYYKKLDELDTIIESLKYFEKNMLKQEKRLDFEGGLNKRGCKVSNR